MSSIRNLIDAIDSGNSIEIENSFNSAMASKVSDKLDAIRKDVAQMMFKNKDVVAGETPVANVETTTDEKA
jgi:hypothetical protein